MMSGQDHGRRWPNLIGMASYRDQHRAHCTLHMWREYEETNDILTTANLGHVHLRATLKAMDLGVTLQLCWRTPNQLCLPEAEQLVRDRRDMSVALQSRENRPKEWPEL